MNIPLSFCNGFALLYSQPAECVKQGPLKRGENSSGRRRIFPQELSYFRFRSPPPFSGDSSEVKVTFKFDILRMELCRWFENLPSDFTLVCVAKPKPWWNSFGLFVGNTDAILVFQTFLYRKLSPVKTAFAQSTKCRVRLWPTKMSSSVRYYYFFVVWLYVFGVGFFFIVTRGTLSLVMVCRSDHVYARLTRVCMSLFFFHPCKL